MSYGKISAKATPAGYHTWLSPMTGKNYGFFRLTNFTHMLQEEISMNAAAD